MGDETLRRLEGHDQPSVDTSIASTAAKILSGGANAPQLPPPAEHIGHTSSPTTKTSFDNASGVSITRPRAETRPLSHMRSMSLADTARQKRLSLHFPVPVQPASAARSPRPPSWIESPLSATPITPLAEVPTSVDQPTESSFLAVLAAQERRVLELKEELNKAEKELTALKKQWSQHEVTRKKQDARRVAQLQPISTLPSPLLDASAEDEDTDGSNMWLQKEMERRKQLLSSVRSSNRRVFSGSKHVRTLSLLSPEKTYTPSFPQPGNVDGESADDGTSLGSDASSTGLLSKQSSVPSETEGQPTAAKTDDSLMGNLGPSLDLTRLQSDAILNTGRKMAADLKDGLWTFFEDIRQATVGDEPINGTSHHRRAQSVHPVGLGARQSSASLRQQRSRGSLRQSSASSTTTSETVRKPEARPAAKGPSLHRRTTTDIIATSPFDIGGSFWRDHGLEEPGSASKKHLTHENSDSRNRTPQRVLMQSDTDDVAWDMWDTPSSKYIASAVPDPSSADSASERGGSARSTPRTSTSSTDPNSLSTNSAKSRDATRDSIPWPALAKLVTPSQLKRTASNLMNEWERSMSPSPVTSRAASPGLKRTAAAVNKQE